MEKMELVKEVHAPKIYVAGAHRELERCSRVIEEVRELGYDVVLDWTASIREFGGDQNDDRVLTERAKNAWADIDAVIEADIVLLLLPRTITKGMHTELGAALMWNRLRARGGTNSDMTSYSFAATTNHKTILASWEDEIAARDEDLPLFVACADNIFDRDVDALMCLHDIRDVR